MRSFLRSASVLTFSQGLVAASSFVRNIVIARHISVADFGIATTFALTMSLAEATSTLAVDRMLVQDDEGDSEAMLASAHLVQFARGLFTGLVMVTLAGPVAGLFGLPEVTWAFQLLAFFPVIRGLIHLDSAVHQRRMEFGATALIDALPQVLSVLVAYLGAVWLGDHRVMLFVVLAQVSLTALVSHCLARRPYRWLWKPELVKRKLAFGWPLLVNGLLMFGIFHGDRVLVGVLYDMHTLGWYSVAFLLALTPTLIFTKIFSYLLMPGLSRTKRDPERHGQQCVFALVLCFGCGAFLATFFAVGGKASLLLAFGQKYSEGADLLMLLAIAQALRVIRVAPAMIANSQARTKNAMYANLVRSAALPVGALLGWLGYGVEWLATSAIAGEMLAGLTSFRLLQLEGFKARFTKHTFILTSGFMVVSALAVGVFDELDGTPALATSALLVVGGCLLGLLAALALPTIDATTRGTMRLALVSLEERVAARGR